MGINRRSAHLFAVVAACGLAYGCAGPSSWSVGPEQHRPPLQSLAGSVHVSVLSVMPFEKFKDQLQPEFKLSETEAFAKVLPATTQIDERLLSGLSAQLGAGLPTTTVTDTKEFNDVDNPDRLTKSERREERKAGSAPTPNKPTEGLASVRENNRLAPPAPTTTLPSNFTPQLEPALQYLAATALKQEVTLLSNYVKYAPIDEGYVAYVVRMQVSLMPRSRGIPYDATTTLSFLPSIGGSSANGGQTTQPEHRDTPGSTAGTAGNQGKQESSAKNPAAQFAPVEQIAARTEESRPDQTGNLSVRVIPLLVTDNLEAARRSMSREDVLRLALALTAQIKGVGARVDLESVFDRLENVLSTEFNSLMTIGRAGDNSLVVRFGAARIGTSKYEMVARTHNVTALVLVPKPSKGPFPLSIASRTIMSDATDPLRPVIGRVWPDRLDEARQRLRAYDVRIERDCDKATMSGSLAESTFLDLIKAVQENDPGRYSELLRLGKQNEVLAPAEAQLLWADLVSVRQGSQFSLTSVRLPKWTATEIRPLPRQTVTALDDGETVSAVVDGVGDVAMDRLSAALVVGGQRLIARSASKSGQSVEFLFESPQLWKLTTGDAPWVAKLDVAYKLNSASETGAAAGSTTFPDRMSMNPVDGNGELSVAIRSPRDPAKSNLVLMSATSQIFAKAVANQADLSGSATIEISLTDPVRNVDMVRVRVRGGNPGAISGVNTDGLDYLVSVNGRTALTIPLTGLTKGTAVKIGVSSVDSEPNMDKSLALDVVEPPK